VHGDGGQRTGSWFARRRSRAPRRGRLEVCQGKRPSDARVESPCDPARIGSVSGYAFSHGNVCPIAAPLQRRRQKRRFRVRQAEQKRPRNSSQGRDLRSGGHGARTRNPLRGTTFPVYTVRPNTGGTRQETAYFPRKAGLSFRRHPSATRTKPGSLQHYVQHPKP